jgi:hypothetical protein
MRLVSTLIAIILVTGCTSMKPIELSPDQLQNRISAGELIHEGDTVRIITAEGKKHKLEVGAIADGRIIGDGIEVPIVDITAIEIKEPSEGKSTGLFIGSMGLILVGLAGLTLM